MPKLTDLVINPDAFFEEEAESPRFLLPAGIVLIAGIVELAGGVYTSRYVASATEGDGVGTGATVLFSLPSVLAPFVGWLVVGAVLVAITIYFGGEGNASDTVKVAGWGFVPSVVGSLVGLGVMVYVLSGTEPSGIEEAVNMQMEANEAVESAEMRALRYTLVAWQGYLWTFGVSHVRNVKLRSAAVAGGAAAALVVLWNAYGGTTLLRITEVL